MNVGVGRGARDMDVMDGIVDRSVDRSVMDGSVDRSVMDGSVDRSVMDGSVMEGIGISVVFVKKIELVSSPPRPVGESPPPVSPAFPPPWLPPQLRSSQHLCSPS